MKTILPLLALFGSAALLTSAQPAPPSGDSGVLSAGQEAAGLSANYTVTTRGPDQRTWQRVEYETTRSGRRIPHIHSYIELETSMHYWASNRWNESQELIEAYPGGAIAQHGATKVIFANNLNTPTAIDLQTPDGQRLQSHPIGLAYFDSASGQSVLIAEVKDCQGQMVSANQVVYPDAFTDFRADVRYTYKKAQFEQDIVLLERPPTPEEFGLSSATTRLIVMTEFVNPPQPVLKPAPLSPSAGGMTDVSINFGGTRIGRGKAFAIGAADDPAQSKPVGKEWVIIDGRSLLFEEIQVPAIAVELNQLPLPAPPALTSVRSGSPLHVVSATRLLPAPPRVQTAEADQRAMQLASLAHPAQGFVLDYVSLTGSTNDFTFKGDTTYYVNGSFRVLGTLTIEGGTVIKYDESATFEGITPYAGVKFETSLYRPAILTSKHDNSAGETISGSTGNPNRYHCTALIFDVGSELLTPVEHLHVRYAAQGLAYWEGTTTLRHCQFVSVGAGIRNSTAPLTVENVLFHGVSGNVFISGNGSYSSFAAAHLTVHNASALAPSGTVLNVTNSLFAWVTNLSQSFTSHSNVTNDNNSMFTTVGAGGHYVTNATYRLGTASISANLLTDFAKMTTYPPATNSVGQTISSSATWSQNPNVLRETGAPFMVGYHYAALDYLVSEVNVNNSSATLTLGEGVALASYGTQGLVTEAGARLMSLGSATKRNQFCFYAAVQEQPVRVGGVAPYSIIAWNGWEPAARLDARFTDFNGLAGSPIAWGFTLECKLRDCLVAAGGFWLESPYAGGGYVMGFTNNLIERSWLSVGTLDWMCPLFFYNNTVHNSTVSIANDSATDGYRTVRDNLFDQSTVYVAYPEYVAYDHNFYYQSSTTLTPRHTGDLTLTNLQYATGPLGNRYIASANPTLVNAGSRSADLAGLNDYTIMPSQTRDGSEGNGNPVDIGFHYPAMSAVCFTASYDLAVRPASATNLPSCVGLYLVLIPSPFGGEGDVTVYFTLGGTAVRGADYVLTNTVTGQSLTNFVTISPTVGSATIQVCPLYSSTLAFDKTMSITLQPNPQPNGYGLFDDPDCFPSVSMTIVDNKFQVVTNLSSAIGIDYSPTAKALIVSLLNGSPSFWQINSNGNVSKWSGITGLPNDEVKLAIVKTNLGGFTNGDMFFGNETKIGWLSADGTKSNVAWCTLSNAVTGENTVPLRGSLYVDQTGVFSNNLIAVTSYGSGSGHPNGVWRIDSQTNAFLLTNLDTLHLEGVITLPNDTNKWGTWAGKIISGDEDQHLIYAIDTNGMTTTFYTTNWIAGGIDPEDFDIIVTNQDLYCANYAGSGILKLPRTYFTNEVGKLLIVQAGEGLSTGPKLFIVHLDGTNVVARSISLPTSIFFGEFEHVSFAPINIPSHPPP